MSHPVVVTFHGIPPSEWIEQDIHRQSRKLDRSCRTITSFRAVVDIPHRHHAIGNRFDLRIDLTVPGEEIAVTRSANLHAASKDLKAKTWAKQFDVEAMRKDIRLVVREAFDVARRRLRDYARRHRLAVKQHTAAKPRRRT